MIQLIEIALLVAALGLLVPVTVLFGECTAALLPQRQRTESHPPAPRPRIDILVPAYNEAVGISATLKLLLSQLAPQDRLVVIADNCDDATAAIARAVGATVIERQDPDCRGKGYAIDYGLRFIAGDPPDVVVMVDADCVVDPGTIEQIARLAVTVARPVQATYLLTPPANPGPKDAVSALAFMVKNLVRPRGLAQVGLPCLLTGTGMAFPWPLICQASLANSNLVEDMQLGLDLAMAGTAPIFCSEANVTGLLPQHKHAVKSQRTRWEQGHLQTLLTQVPQLLRATVQQKRLDLLAIALDLSVPPLSLLVMLWIAAMGGALLAGMLGVSWTPAILLAAEGLLILISIVGAWVKFGRAQLPLLALLAAPLYVLWKIPLYLAFLVRPEKKWIRTERD